MKAQKKLYRAARFLFVAYCIIMIWLLFGQRVGFSYGGGYIENLIKNSNLIPFATIVEQVRHLLAGSYKARHCFINLGGNVIMFLPLGLLMPLIWDKLRSFGRFILTVTVMIVVVELLQLVTLLGSMDIDDLILNLCGASVGFLLNSAAAAIYNKTKKSDKR